VLAEVPLTLLQLTLVDVFLTRLCLFTMAWWFHYASGSHLRKGSLA